MAGEPSAAEMLERRVLLTDGGESEASDDEEGDGSDGENQDGAEEGEGEDGEAEEEEEGEETEDEESEESEEEEGEDEEEDEGATVLYLDIGDGLFLNLLGLEVDLAEVELDVSAVPGDNRLVGNLLNAVAGLLDKPSLPDLDELFGGLGGKVSDSIRNAGSAIMEELDLGQLLRDIVSGFVDELGGSSDGDGGNGNGNGSEG